MKPGSLNGFVAPLPMNHASHEVLPSGRCPPRRQRSTLRPLGRIAPTARVRRGFKPDPEIPETLFLAEPIKDVDFQPVDFSKFKGNVVLAINVASEDGYTDSNYTLLASLLEKYHGSGFRVLAFPSNWYGQKETGSNEEIKKFVHGKYSNKIIVMNKTDLDWNQVFALGCHYFPGEIIWNFHGKFLFDRNGYPVERFDLLTPDEYIQECVQREVLRGVSASVEEATVESDSE